MNTNGDIARTFGNVFEYLNLQFQKFLNGPMKNTVTKIIYITIGRLTTTTSPKGHFVLGNFTEEKLEIIFTMGGNFRQMLDGIDRMTRFLKFIQFDRKLKVYKIILNFSKYKQISKSLN